ncbi:MAG: LLM class flavin-dependent oxidoreductase [Deltaproteobacteria bacterium]|nr:MAG: LLM class flavin-dependent oxidoreductase [Deltaproteobacteria bacterium]
MKFGIFFELSVPRPFSPEREREVIVNALEQARLADALGFECAWVVEHHFLEEYSHSSAPELFLTAVAMQTQRIRVGHGAVVCVPEINHPIRVAERAAFLDLLSGGRLEFGTARSSTWTEIGGFEADPDDTKKDWDEYVRVLPKMWMQETFVHRGRCFSMPERAVLPKPLQKPHPPMWVTVTSPGTELDAADRGLGCLGVAAASYAEQERRTREYHRRIQLCDPVGAAVNDRVAILNFLYCHEDATTAAEHGLRFLGTFGLLNAHLLFTREVYPTSAYQSLANLAPAPSSKGGPGDRPGVPDGICIGDPKEIIAAVKRWESIGVDQINVLLNASEVLAQDQVLASLRLFAKEVMPVFASELGA